MPNRRAASSLSPAVQRPPSVCRHGARDRGVPARWSFPAFRAGRYRPASACHQALPADRRRPKPGGAATQLPAGARCPASRRPANARAPTAARGDQAGLLATLCARARGHAHPEQIEPVVQVGSELAGVRMAWVSLWCCVRHSASRLAGSLAHERRPHDVVAARGRLQLSSSGWPLPSRAAGKWTGCWWIRAEDPIHKRSSVSQATGIALPAAGCARSVQGVCACLAARV